MDSRKKSGINSTHLLQYRAALLLDSYQRTLVIVVKIVNISFGGLVFIGNYQCCNTNGCNLILIKTVS
jgi:hypothetical protein